MITKILGFIILGPFFLLGFLGACLVGIICWAAEVTGFDRKDPD